MRDDHLKTTQIQHNLDMCIMHQREAHNALIEAAEKTQYWRDIMSRREQQLNANAVVQV